MQQDLPDVGEVGQMTPRGGNNKSEDAKEGEQQEQQINTNVPAPEQVNSAENEQRRKALEDEIESLRTQIAEK